MELGVLQKATLGGAKLEPHRSSGQSRYVGILGGCCLLLSLPAQGGGGHNTYQISDPTRTLPEAMAVPRVGRASAVWGLGSQGHLSQVR